MKNPNCPICSHSLRESEKTSRVSVRECMQCGHRTARHLGGVSPTADYHLQYTGGDYVEALGALRREQAVEIVDGLSKRSPAPRRVLDFGCGRGWFLEAAAGRGWELAGADSSALAVQAAKNQGATPIAVPAFCESGWELPQALGAFRADTWVLLDMIEHFPVDGLYPALSGLIGAAGSTLRQLVVKVPTSTGLLYSGARWAARLGQTGPLDQLYQVGTEPPHYHYFSPRSLRLLVERLGFVPEHEIGMPDFQAEGFSSRVAALRSLPTFVGGAIGRGLHGLVGATGKTDSLVLFARRAHP